MGYADIALTTGFVEAKQMSYVYDERLSYFGRMQYDYKEISIVSNAKT
jgi:hypothetical protein